MTDINKFRSVVAHRLADGSVIYKAALKEGQSIGQDGMNNLTTCAFKSANSRDIIATVSASGIERGSVLAEVHDSFGTLTHLSLRADVAINDLNSSFAASERSKNAEQALEQLHSINQNDQLSDPFGDDFLSDELDSVSLNHSDDLLRGFSDDNDSALEAPHYFFASNNRKNNENLSVSERKDNDLHSATSDINPTPPQMPKTGRNDAYMRNEDHLVNSGYDFASGSFDNAAAYGYFSQNAAAYGQSGSSNVLASSNASSSSLEAKLHSDEQAKLHSLSASEFEQSQVAAHSHMPMSDLAASTQDDAHIGDHSQFNDGRTRPVNGDQQSFAHGADESAMYDAAQGEVSNFNHEANNSVGHLSENYARSEASFGTHDNDQELYSQQLEYAKGEQQLEHGKAHNLAGSFFKPSNEHTAAEREQAAAARAASSIAARNTKFPEVLNPGELDMPQRVIHSAVVSPEAHALLQQTDAKYLNSFRRKQAQRSESNLSRMSAFEIATAGGGLPRSEQRALAEATTATSKMIGVADMPLMPGNKGQVDTVADPNGNFKPGLRGGTAFRDFSTPIDRFGGEFTAANATACVEISSGRSTRVSSTREHMGQPHNQRPQDPAVATNIQGRSIYSQNLNTLSPAAEVEVNTTMTVSSGQNVSVDEAQAYLEQSRIEFMKAAAQQKAARARQAQIDAAQANRAQGLSALSHLSLPDVNTRVDNLPQKVPDMPVSHQAVKVDKPSARYAFASSDYVAITKERIDEKDLLADEQQPAEGISEPILYDKRELKALHNGANKAAGSFIGTPKEFLEALKKQQDPHQGVNITHKHAQEQEAKEKQAQAQAEVSAAAQSESAHTSTEQAAQQDSVAPASQEKLNSSDSTQSASAATSSTDAAAAKDAATASAKADTQAQDKEATAQATTASDSAKQPEPQTSTPATQEQESVLEHGNVIITTASQNTSVSDVATKSEDKSLASGSSQASTVKPSNSPFADFTTANGTSSNDVYELKILSRRERDEIRAREAEQKRQRIAQANVTAQELFGELNSLAKAQADLITKINQAKQELAEQIELARIEAERLEAERKAAEEAARLEAERKAAEEAARIEAERKAAEEAARLEAERKAAEEAARIEAERKAAEEAARLEAERKAAEEAARLEAERKAAEEAARLEAERKAAEEAARIEAERKAAEEAARIEAERKAAEEAARIEAERKAAEEAARLEAERKAAEEAARIEAERKAAEEAARIEAERKAAEEAARIEAERKAAEEAARLEAERKAAEEAARIEAERKAAEEAARIEAERKAAEEAARLEAERKAAEEAARIEAERKAAEEAARLEAERKAAEEAARLEAERKAAEEAARIEAERKAAEEAARLEAERKAAEEAARLEAERKAAEEAARIEAERKAAEEAARIEAERKAAEEAARIEAERKAAEEAARIEAERKAAEEAARIEAERKAAEEAARIETERKAAEEESEERESSESEGLDPEIEAFLASERTRLSDEAFAAAKERNAGEPLSKSQIARIKRKVRLQIAQLRLEHMAKKNGAAAVETSVSSTSSAAVKESAAASEIKSAESSSVQDIREEDLATSISYKTVRNDKDAPAPKISVGTAKVNVTAEYTHQSLEELSAIISGKSSINTPLNVSEISSKASIADKARDVNKDAALSATDAVAIASSGYIAANESTENLINALSQEMHGGYFYNAKAAKSKTTEEAGTLVIEERSETEGSVEAFEHAIEEANTHNEDESVAEASEHNASEAEQEPSALVHDPLISEDVIFATPTRFVDNEDEGAVVENKLVSESGAAANLEATDDAARAVQAAVADVVAESFVSPDLLADEFSEDEEEIDDIEIDPTSYEQIMHKSSNSLASLAAELIDDFDDPYDEKL
ncbi:hypothetical protein [Anaerobiospirillum succiniciproducens]|uniref:hypothetical protein n=1 Tax=Anaerobiospirillum succiniciproducens TaxID=13335 RepID=UPI000416B3B1|nr:hypothetical protein [Anaerobiospirillum succiniciproducens]